MFKQFSYGSLSLCFSLSVLLLSGCGGASSGGDGNFSIDPSTATVALGRKLFFDERLSSNGNQSCASCHDPVSGFADDRVTKASPVSEGSLADSFGNRNAPTAAYASHSPEFGLVVDQTGETDSKYHGGQFLDGRSSTLTLQAMEPFRNPKEMNNSSDAAVVEKVRNSTYATDFIGVFGSGSLDNDITAYINIAVAIAAFEASAELNPFTSKYDAFIHDKVSNPLNTQEARGLALFKDDTKARCANCHTLDDSDEAVPSDSLFTNFEYYNIGTPVNPGTPTSLAIDLGLGGVTSETAEEGKFKVPTLRNVELTAPYMHNGVFETLEQVIIHYDLFGTDNITPEVDRNIAVEMGDRSQFNPIGLSAQEIADIEAFMLTLTDGHF